MSFAIRIAAVLALATVVRAADTKPTQPAQPSPDKAPWVCISDDITAKYTAEGKKNEQTAGVAVDRTNGDVYLIVNAHGMAKSTDQGKTFELVSGKAISGRCETGFGLNMDPAGTRLMCFMIYGSAGYTPDGGKTWVASKVSHLDFGAVVWSAAAGDKALPMLSIGHESGGQLLYTTDQSKEWKKLDKNFGSPIGMFDEKTLIATKKDMMRSTDAGATWAKVENGLPATVKQIGRVVVVFNDVGYLATDQGLFITKDKGATWAIQGKPVNGFLGPYFGKDEKQIVVCGKDGIMRTDDAGETWNVVGQLPAGWKFNGTGMNLAWDPARNIFYASTMFQPAYKWEVK